MKIRRYINIFAVLVFLLVFLKFGKLYSFLFGGLYIIIYIFPSIMVMLGNLNYSKNKLKESEWYFRLAYLCVYAPVKHKLLYSYILILQQNLDAAEKVINSLSNKNMNSVDFVSLNINKSLIYWKKGNLDKAIDILYKVYKDYKTMVLYQNLGYFLILKGDYEAALKFNLEAYEFDKSNLGILDNLAECYYYMEDYDKAIGIFENINDKGANFASPYYYYALTLDKIGKREEAINVLKKALECKFTYLSAIKQEDITAKLSELE